MSAKFLGARVCRALAAAALLMPLALVAQQRDATGPQPAAAGTGEISGVVMSAETTPQVLRRVVVTITGGVPMRSTLTDDQGRFVFAKLPAGTFSVTARKAAYIAAPYGSRKPGRAGMPIALSNGQKTSITISMFRGSVISGAVRDASGLPVGGVDIRLIDARTLLTMPEASSEVGVTDDRGVFRVYGLLPGDYYVVALPTPSGAGEITAPTSALLDSALATLTARRGASSAPGPPPAPSPPPRPIGFSPVFYPGTPHHEEAARVHVDAGEERAGVDFELRPVAMAAIDGIVRTNNGDMSGVQITIIPMGPRVSMGMSSNSLSGRGLDAQGRFRYANMPPGKYRLVARGRQGEIPAAPAVTVVNGVVQGRGGASGGSGEAPRPTSGDYLYGLADVDLRGEDVEGVALDLRPGGTVTGRIVFNGAPTTPKPEDLTKLRATLSLEGATGMVSSNGLTMGNSLLSNPIATVRPDGTFEIRGIGPGRFTLGVGLPTTADAGIWKLRSAIAGDRDLLDDLLELGPGIDVPNVVVTFTDARTEISGTLQSGAGQITTDYYIVALPLDRSLWRPKARRILSVRPATDGRFVFADPPAGEYLIAALSDLDPLELMDVAFLEQIVPAGVKVAVAEGERRVQDLKIR